MVVRVQQDPSEADRAFSTWTRAGIDPAAVVAALPLLTSPNAEVASDARDVLESLIDEGHVGIGGLDDPQVDASAKFALDTVRELARGVPASELGYTSGAARFLPSDSSMNGALDSGAPRMASLSGSPDRRVAPNEPLQQHSTMPSRSGL